jgi:thiamine-phosphate pyrophosphorylase
VNSYLITDPSIYTHNIETFKQQLQASFSIHQPDYALYRDKAFEEYDTFAAVFVDICKQYNVKAILHNKALLAEKLLAYGVHFSGDKLCSIGIHSNRLFQVLSCHTPEEIHAAAILCIDAVTFSPIFATPNKGEPKGVKVLNDIVNQSPIPVIALGGILTQAEVDQVAQANAWAFASIRYFKS